MIFYLSSKASSYLVRLHREYEREGNTLERDIIAGCRSFVVEETTFDNWNGGTYGHDLRLYVPLEILEQIPIRNQEGIADRICSDLNVLCQHVPNESWNAVQIELSDENDLAYQSAIPFSNRPPVDPAALSIWKAGMVRLFISHRDAYKGPANQLASILEGFGISSFVAHDTIKPMTEWRLEIMRGLETMEVMLVFLTNDFQESTWTNQEVGFAIGAKKPIISLKLEGKDPPGFIGHEQALKGRMDDLEAVAPAVYSLLGKALNAQARLQEGLVTSFCESPDFSETRDRFNRLNAAVTRLEDTQLEKVIEAYAKNDQLHNSIWLGNDRKRLQGFLDRVTDQRVEVRQADIVKRRAKPLTEDDLPF
ncbi:toll/interleukin-1 receptor domain-containing protein [Lichenibacterium minor]|uniref:Toll/interleukin-1 receptor domain-containing protein n=1 Tax=Lichenibacterium minor TaxID=2316528 RepID=A0A4Q2UC35_9HYPH|nr:toll/interleukin-1 receptor domain-containing protein [Lichenibacterium minor]RYC33628.1 toll/interleukin-1 receptor domain-containing protein [Lichenibacterium minor]